MYYSNTRCTCIRYIGMMKKNSITYYEANVITTHACVHPFDDESSENDKCNYNTLENICTFVCCLYL